MTECQFVAREGDRRDAIPLQTELLSHECRNLQAMIVNRQYRIRLDGQMRQDGLRGLKRLVEMHCGERIHPPRGCELRAIIGDGNHLHVEFIRRREEIVVAIAGNGKE